MRFAAIALIGAVMALSSCTSATEDADLTAGNEAVQRGDYVSAEESYAKLVAKNPRDAIANLNMGLVMAETGRRDEAIKYYQVAVMNGKDVPVGLMLVPGESEGKVYQGTVADLASRNLKNLGVGS